MDGLTYIVLYISGCIAIGLSAGALFLWLVRVPLQNWIDKKFPKLDKDVINQLKNKK